MWMNVAVVAIVGLIAYWWATQGFFSAVLHMFSCILAGAVAFAAWEVLAIVAFGKLNKPILTDMSWGISLVFVYVAALHVLRVFTTHACPANTHCSTAANFLGGGAVGAVAGVVNAGILLIALQFVQGPTAIFGYGGWRVAPSGELEQETALWIPVDRLTTMLYSEGSRGAMWVPEPLAYWHPDLDKQAGLYRQSYEEGKSRMGINPDQYSLDWVRRLEPQAAIDVIEEIGNFIDRDSQLRAGQGDAYHVRCSFNTAAWDDGSKLYITRSQARLIVQTPEGESVIVPPHAWIQPVTPASPQEGRWIWDSPETPATSVGSPSSAPVTFEFIVPAGSTLSQIIVRQGRKDITSIDQANVVTGGDVAAYTAAGVGAGLPAPSAPSLPTPKHWFGYMIMALLAGLTLFSNLLPSKRSHQD